MGIFKKKRFWAGITLAGICSVCGVSGTSGSTSSTDDETLAIVTTTQNNIAETQYTYIEEDYEMDIEINPMWYFEEMQYYGYPYEMTEKSRTFVTEHMDLFPAENSEAFSDYINYELQCKHLNKNIDKYGDEIFYVDGYVVDITEDTSTVEDIVLTTVHIEDVEGYQYIILYYGELEFFEGDLVSVYGLPLGITYFDNISGTTTVAVVLGGCNVEPYEVY